MKILNLLNNILLIGFVIVYLGAGNGKKLQKKKKIIFVNELFLLWRIIYERSF